MIYADVNRDGNQSDGEIGWVGLLLWLRQDGITVGQIQSGVGGAYAFDHVPLGAWEVEAHTPPGYEVTTAGGNPAHVSVKSGAQVVVDFGFALAPTATATVTLTPTPTPTATTTATPLPQQYLPLVLQPH